MGNNNSKSSTGFIFTLIFVLILITVGILIALKKIPIPGLPCKPSDSEKVNFANSYKYKSGGKCVPKSCITGYNLNDDSCDNLLPPDDPGNNPDPSGTDTDCVDYFNLNDVDTCLGDGEGGIIIEWLPNSKACTDKLDRYIAELSSENDPLLVMESTWPGDTTSIGWKGFNAKGGSTGIKWEDGEITLKVTAVSSDNKILGKATKKFRKEMDSIKTCTDTPSIHTRYLYPWWNNNDNLLGLSVYNKKGTKTLGYAATQREIDDGLILYDDFHDIGAGDSEVLILPKKPDDDTKGTYDKLNDSEFIFRYGETGDKKSWPYSSEDVLNDTYGGKHPDTSPCGDGHKTIKPLSEQTRGSTAKASVKRLDLTASLGGYRYCITSKEAKDTDFRLTN